MEFHEGETLSSIKRSSITNYARGDKHFTQEALYYTRDGGYCLPRQEFITIGEAYYNSQHDYFLFRTVYVVHLGMPFKQLICLRGRAYIR